MKNTKFLVGALVLSMGVLGVGYAAWADVLTINTTVDTASFDMDFTTPVKATVAQTENNGVTVTAEAILGATPVDKQDTNDAQDTMTISITNLHPEATVTQPITIRNAGEIKAYLAGVTVEGVKDQLTDNQKAGLVFTIKSGSTTKEVTFSNLKAALEDVIEKEFAVKHEQLINLTIGLNDEHKQNDVQNQSLGFTIKLDWSQAQPQPQA